MDVFDWVALIGAAAWLPQILVVIYWVLVKPRAVLIPVPELELGYTYYGPILNMKASLFAERKDALILEMKLFLRHEDGREIVLHWHSFTEEFSQLRDASGEAAKVTKDQMATALQVSTSVPTTKFIRFQDSSFQDETRGLFGASDQELNRLQAAEVDDPVGEYLTSKEHTQLLSHFRHGFPWEPGRYQFWLRMEIQGRRRPAVAESAFVLRKSDVDRLRTNIDVIERQAELFARGAEDQLAREYQWINPRLEDKDVMTHK